MEMEIDLGAPVSVSICCHVHVHYCIVHVINPWAISHTSALNRVGL